MISRIALIAENILTKLKDTNIKKQIHFHLKELKEDNLMNSPCIHYLLYSACKFDMLNEMHELLDLDLYQDINQPLKPREKLITSHQKWQWVNRNNRTPLGLAAYYGNIESVQYLVEVQCANVNSTDSHGDTALHHTIYGDSCNYIQNVQDQIAKYLLRNGSDISIKNNKGHTPYDLTRKCAPYKVEQLLGRRVISPALSYDADKVRPILEKEITDKEVFNLERKTLGFASVIVTTQPKQKNFEVFCLEHAIELYTKTGKLGYGFATVEEMHKKLIIPYAEKERECITSAINSQKPSPYSSKMGLVYKELPQLCKQSLALGIGTTLILYYGNLGIFWTIIAGSGATSYAFQYLLDRAYNAKVSEEKQIEERIDNLQIAARNRFFEVPVPGSVPEGRVMFKETLPGNRYKT